MTAGTLRAKLATVPSGHTVLTDLPLGALAENTIVAVGLADKISNQNGQSAYYLEHEVARPSSPEFATASVYIGTGVGITAPKWTLL